MGQNMTVGYLFETGWAATAPMDVSAFDVAVILILVDLGGRGKGPHPRPLSIPSERRGETERSIPAERRGENDFAGVRCWIAGSVAGEGVG